MNLIWFVLVWSAIVPSGFASFLDLFPGKRQWNPMHKPGKVEDFPGSNPDVLYRADSRSWEEIQEAGGFWAKPGVRTADRYNLFSHIMGEIENTAYVSTTSSLKVARDYAENVLRDPKNTQKTAYIYQIQPSAHFVDVTASMRTFISSTNDEFAAMTGFPVSQIKGSVHVTAEVLHNYRDAHFSPNPGFVEPAHKTSPSVMPELCVWPDGHPGWEEPPWKTWNRAQRKEDVIKTYQGAVEEKAGSHIIPKDMAHDAPEVEESIIRWALKKAWAWTTRTPTHTTGDHGTETETETETKEVETDGAVASGSEHEDKHKVKTSTETETDEVETDGAVASGNEHEDKHKAKTSTETEMNEVENGDGEEPETEHEDRHAVRMRTRMRMIPRPPHSK